MGDYRILMEDKPEKGKKGGARRGGAIEKMTKNETGETAIKHVRRVNGENRPTRGGKGKGDKGGTQYPGTGGKSRHLGEAAQTENGEGIEGGGMAKLFHSL